MVPVGSGGFWWILLDFAEFGWFCWVLVCSSGFWLVLVRSGLVLVMGSGGF
jgi:hypothetical protein